MSWLKNKLRQFDSVSKLEAMSNYYFPFVIRLISVKSKKYLYFRRESTEKI
jgi:hypothetical protein